MTTQELKPCPFCGETPEEVTHLKFDDGSGYWEIECTGTCAARPSVDGNTEQEVIQAWNTRPSLPEGGVREVEDEDRWEQLAKSIREFPREPILNLVRQFFPSLLTPKEGRGE